RRVVRRILRLDGRERGDQQCSCVRSSPVESIDRTGQRLNVSAAAMPRHNDNCPPAFLLKLAEKLERQRLNGRSGVLDGLAERQTRLDRVGPNVHGRKDYAARRLAKRKRLSVRLHPVEPDRIVVRMPLDRAPRDVGNRGRRTDRVNLVRPEPLKLSKRQHLTSLLLHEMLLHGRSEERRVGKEGGSWVRRVHSEDRRKNG